MYFPVGLPHVFHGCGGDADADVEDVLSVAHSHDGVYLAVCCQHSIHLWKSFPLIHLCTYRRAKASIHEHGVNLKILWRADRRLLAVALSKGFVQLLAVDEDEDASRNLLYDVHFKRGQAPSSGICLLSNVPMRMLKHMGPLHSSEAIPILGPTATHMVNCKDSILVSSTSSIVERIPWDNPFLESSKPLALSSIRFPDRENIIPEGIHVVHMAFSATMRLLALVLSNGRTVCMLMDAEESEVNGCWIDPPPARPGLPLHQPKFLCAAINPKFRLLALGASNGQTLIFTMDDVLQPVLSHTLSVEEALSLSAFQASEAVHDLEWSPDCHALAVGYETCGFAVWSVFGSCLLRPLQDTDASRSLTPLGCRSLSWAAEGFRLLTVPRAGVPGLLRGDVLYSSFVKSSLTTCPNTSNQATVLLLVEDRIYVNPDSNGRLSDSIDKLCDAQWQSIPLPPAFHLACWPLRFAVVDTAGVHIAVVGVSGLALYNMLTHKWRQFGSQAQEQSLHCRGGLAWWRGLIFVGCTDYTSHKDEIRVYNSNASLDERNVVLRRPMGRAVTLLSIYGDYMLSYSYSRKMQVFKLTAAEGPKGATVDISLVWTLDVLDHISSPQCVVSLSLVSMGLDSIGSAWDANYQVPNAVLANAAGKLMIFHLDTSTKGKGAPPALLATGVEMCWAPCAWHVDPVQRQLSQAIWLGCGAQGMQVWLALQPLESDELQITKRVMLTLGSTVSALSVLFYDLVLVGAVSEASPVSFRSGCVLPFFTLQRQAHLYLHHILRQLLRRSLDSHALQIARACVHLSYFSHVLELMLHEVLEEEAVNDLVVVREDALLPRVAAFISHFPNYRQIVVYCARKTEVSKWAYLFSVVGSPRELFEQCVAEKQYDIAASYLVIMQSLDSPSESRAHAIALLHTVLDTQRWDLAKDIVRFLQVTADADRSPPMTKQADHEAAQELLSSYALSLLQAGRIYQLGNFAAHTGFSLIRWLRSVRGAEARIQDFAAAVARVQRDFQAATSPGTHAEPTRHRSVTPVMAANGERTDSEVASMCDSEVLDVSIAAEDLQSALEGYVLSSQSNHVAQMQYMLQAMLRAGCLEWAFVLALVLRDRQAISTVLDEIAMDSHYDGGIHTLMARFEPSLRTDSVAVYQEFYDNVAGDRRQVHTTADAEEREPPPQAAPAEVQQSDCVVS